MDYSTLEIRHLGSIYEGLLEYKLRVADEYMVVNGGEWVKLEDYNKDRKQKKVFSDFDEFDRVKKGQLYLATDKGERKATGSYYTPDYIVNYIVKNTVGHVVDEKWKEAREKKQGFVEATLSVKVLDPAMGSGHFLVGSIEFLSEKLLLAVKKDIDNGRFSDESHLTSDWARREVVAHCIYGVDLNDLAVELAKVSLWLTTISKEKPLSFLDHRLKQGNSLIGAHLEDLPHYPEVNAKKKERKVKDAAQQTFEVDIEKPFFIKIVKILKSLTDINDDSIENINKKKDIFKSLLDSPEYQRIKAFANLHTAIYFGVVTTKVDKLPKDGYNDVLWALRLDEEGWNKKTNREWFGKARKLAEQKSFFHWELEFPEIFFEGSAPKENRGWDAVVGNPPYVRIQELQKADPSQVNFFNTAFASATSSYDIYVLFNEFGLQCLNRNGRLGMIQLSKFIQADFGKGIRKILPKYLDKILDFRENQVFDVSTYTCLLFLSKIDQQNWSYFAMPALKNVEKEMPKLLNQKVDFSLISKDLTDAPWVLSDQDNLKILRKLNLFPEKLQDVITNIFQGIATSADHIYFLEEIEKIGANEIKVFSRSTNSEWILEIKYLKPLLKGEDVHRYAPLEPKIWTIFPYDLSNQNPHLLSSDEIKNRSPKLWEYLKLNEAELRKREHGRYDIDEWWQFKIMTPDICNKGEISFDNIGHCHTSNCSILCGIRRSFLSNKC